MSQGEVLDRVDVKEAQRARTAMKASVNENDLANSLAEGQGQDSKAYQEKLAAEAAERARHLEVMSQEVADQEHRIAVITADIAAHESIALYTQKNAETEAKIKLGGPAAEIHAKVAETRKQQITDLHTKLAHPDINLDSLRQMLEDAKGAKEAAEIVRDSFEGK